MNDSLTKKKKINWYNCPLVFTCPQVLDKYNEES